MKFPGFMMGVFVLFASGPVQAQVPEAVSYNEYLQQVLDYYPSLKKEYASVEKAVSQKAMAASTRVPQLWSSVKFEYGDDPVYVFGALLRQNRFSGEDFVLGRLNTPGPISNNAASVEGQWLLFDFSQTASRVKSAGLLEESARYQAELTKMEAILAASEVYSRLALIQELIKVMDEATSEGGMDIAAAESLNQKGLSLGADFYLARMTHAKLLQAKNEMIAQQAALSMAFNILRGKDPAVPVMVTVDFQKQLSLKGTAPEWMAKTVENRLDIKVMGKLLEARGVEVDRAKKSFLPEVSAYGQADKSAHSLVDRGGDNYVVGVKAAMDMFDPGHGPRVKSAQAEVDRLASQYRELKDQGAKDAAETYFRLEALKSNAQLAVKARDDARQAVRLMGPLYREGKRSIEQILHTRANLVGAYEYWLNLENSFRQSILILKFYAGELDQQQAEEIYGR